MDELLTVIMIWLASNFQLEPAPQPPRVAVLQERSIATMRADIAAAHFGRRAPPSACVPAVHAFYYPHTHTIFLTEGWRADEVAHASILVHELVHHLQETNEIPFGCAAERERLAYEAQDRWLAQFGTSLEAEFGIDAMTRLALSTCSR